MLEYLDLISGSDTQYQTYQSQQGIPLEQCRHSKFTNPNLGALAQLLLRKCTKLVTYKRGAGKASQ